MLPTKIAKSEFFFLMFSSAECSVLSIEGFSHSLITKIRIEINADPQHWLHNTIIVSWSLSALMF